MFPPISNVLVSYDPQRKVWHGPTDPTSYKSNNVWEKILEYLTSHPDQIFQIYEQNDEIFVCERVKLETFKAVGQFQRWKITKDHIVILLIEDWRHLTPLVLASILLGTKFCVLPTQINRK